MINEKIIVGENTRYPLKGLLTLPDDLASPVPAVVMVHGSGASNMDEKVGKLTPFKDLAEGLAERGIGSLRYDKRTYSHPLKMLGVKPTVYFETIEDALLATEMLKKDARIDSNRIFILGHSMGAMLAPRIDAEGADVRGLIMMAATPFRLEDIVLRQFKQAQGGNVVMDRIMKYQYKKYAAKFENLYQMSEDKARKEKFAANLTLYYFQEMGRKTAADYLAESDKPALIMQGEKDFQVLAEEDYFRFCQLFHDRENTIFRLYPGLDHAFVEALYTDILLASKEFGKERHIPDNVIDDIAEFISKY